jgi:putative flippase GtrA
MNLRAITLSDRQKRLVRFGQVGGIDFAVDFALIWASLKVFACRRGFCRPPQS